MKPIITLVLFLALLIGLAGWKADLIDEHLGKITTPEETGLPNGGWGGITSPDGHHIAFFSSTLHTTPDLWVINTDGSNLQRLTARGAEVARWAADSQSLTFASKRKGFIEVMTVDLASRKAQRVENLPPNSSLPILSPDGGLLAYSVPNDKKGRDLWVSTLDGSHREAVTVDISVRSIFWGKDQRKLYFEAGKTYGVGLWEVDLTSLETKVLFNKYIGTPVYSKAADRIAMPYPDGPGEYSVHTMKPDGSDIQVIASPRLAGRQLAWDKTGEGVYYLGRDLVAAEPQPAADKTNPDEKPQALHDQSLKKQQFVRSGLNALWHLDLASGVETRVSPEDLHLSGFNLADDGQSIALSGVLPDSFATELFIFTPADQDLRRLTHSRPSWWQPVASRDSTELAFFTDRERVDALEVIRLEDSQQLESYPGLTLSPETRLFWLPDSSGKLIFSTHGLLAFDHEGQISFDNKKDHRTYLQADVSVQADQILISAIPKFGELPGLYQLNVDGRAMQQIDLRYPSAPEKAAELYLQPKWSYDGKYMAFSDRQDIWVMKSDGTERRRITRLAEENFSGQGIPGLASFPVWSLNSKYLCYTKLAYAEDRVLRQFWVVGRDGKGQRLVHSEPIESTFQWHQAEATNRPFFDVNDERLIFTAVKEGRPDLYAFDFRTNRKQRLTESGAIYPILLPEEDRIIFTSLAGNNERLWSMDSRGSALKPLTLDLKKTASID